MNPALSLLFRRYGLALALLPGCSGAQPSFARTAAYYREAQSSAGLAVAGEVRTVTLEERGAQRGAQRPAPQRVTPPALTPPAVTPPTSVAPNTVAPVAAAPMLVYTALLELVVNNVGEATEQALGLVRGVGGYESSRRDLLVVLRVPAARFLETLAGLERLGDVGHRELDAEDVSERYHDLDVRLANLRAVRQRLQELLARATNVTEALAVQSELDRVALELDQVEGQLRFFSNRVAFSTITLRLSARSSSAPQAPRTYETPRLNFPFPWLQSLGLQGLLQQ